MMKPDHNYTEGVKDTLVAIFWTALFVWLVNGRDRSLKSLEDEFYAAFGRAYLRP